MTQQELIELMASRLMIPKAKAKRAIDLITDTIRNTVNIHGKMSVAHLGVFHRAIYKGRIGRNPTTGEQIVIPDKLVVRFRPASSFTKKIREES